MSAGPQAPKPYIYNIADLPTMTESQVDKRIAEWLGKLSTFDPKVLPEAILMLFEKKLSFGVERLTASSNNVERLTKYLLWLTGGLLLLTLTLAVLTAMLVCKESGMHIPALCCYR